MNTREKLLLEIQDLPESVVNKMLEILQSLKQQTKEKQTLANVDTNPISHLENDPLLSVIGIFDSEAISSTEIDEELYE